MTRLVIQQYWNALHIILKAILVACGNEQIYSEYHVCTAIKNRPNHVADDDEKQEENEKKKASSAKRKDTNNR
jgi:hypothetical protein